jgi:hypothetical protein
MYEYKVFLGYLSIVIAVVSYVPYFRDIFRGKTKPHAFSWFIWGLLTVIAFVAQIVEKGGAGSWVTGVTSIICFTIFVLAFIKGERRFTVFDWIALAMAIIAILLWRLTNNPTMSVILVTLTDVLGYLPTIRKSYSKPYEETAITYFLSAIKFIVALLALDSLTLTTGLYPTAIILMSLSVVVMLVVRRKQIHIQSYAAK